MLRPILPLSAGGGSSLLTQLPPPFDNKLRTLMLVLASFKPLVLASVQELILRRRKPPKLFVEPPGVFDPDVDADPLCASFAMGVMGLL